MTENPPSRRRMSTSVELLIGAVLGAILGWPITRALDEWAAESQLPWWAYLVGTGIGIAFVLFVMTFIIKAWRVSIWGWVGRLAKWLWDSRPVSLRRHRRDIERVMKSLIAPILEQSREIAREEIASSKMLEDAKAEYARAMTDIAQKIAQRRVNGTVAAAASSSKMIPLPAPRWHIQRVESDEHSDTFTLINSVERSVAREVRVDDSHDYNGEPNGVATILEGGHFEDLSGKASGDFRAEFSPSARQGGGTLDVTWYDDDGEKHHEYVRVAGWEKRPPQPDSWVAKGGQNILNPDETPF
ncbi:hypothetical protein [Agromyces ramosus]|uniref:Uncharacterized protein n=1 Tax=Agromyces ramosus TaxID=33879 RepID=A0ABU0R8W1_9MICO|nr:hypothetical protein [Agromyces ramosus]MDQ0894513.1 hypothetical protein [Agromyces ramosus]